MALNFQNFGGGEADNGRSRFFIFAGVLVAILVSVSGGYVAWQKYFSQSARQLAAFNSYQKATEDAYRNDTYGGATPEETLKLFIEALKKEDVELASKYFALDDNLSKKKWVDYLMDVKKNDLLKQMANDIEMDSKPGVAAYKGDAGFILLNDDGTVGVQIDMEFNSLSKVWKIESL